MTKYTSWSVRPTFEDNESAALRLIGWLVWIPIMAVLLVTAWPLAALWAAWKAGLAWRRRVRRSRGLRGRRVWGGR